MPSKWGARLIGANAVSNALESVVKEFTIDAVWVVGTNVEYSVYVEFGTSRMAAQPYLRPAVEQVARDAKNIVRSARSLNGALAKIALEIERIAKKLCPVDTGKLRASIAAEQVR